MNIFITTCILCDEQDRTVKFFDNVSCPDLFKYFVFQNFIRRCLQYKKEMRPDVLVLSIDDYLKPSAMKAKGG